MAAKELMKLLPQTREVCRRHGVRDGPRFAQAAAHAAGEPCVSAEIPYKYLAGTAAHQLVAGHLRQ